MNGGYESLIWVRDSNGSEYVCSLHDVREGFRDGGELTDDERARCVNVNEIVGTERW